MINTYTTERCRNCKRQEFQYDEPNLICTRCGAVNFTEEISPNEMDQLVQTLKNMTTEQQIDPRLLEYAQQHTQDLGNRSIEELLAEVKVEPQKRPKPRNKGKK